MRGTSTREAAREHPVRLAIRLAVVVYVTGLIITLIVGQFLEPTFTVYRPPECNP